MSKSTQQRILDAACQIYVEHGIDALSMRKLGQAIGLSATAIYRHYDDKDALQVAMIDEGFRRFGESMFHSLGAGDSGQRLTGASEGYLDFALSDPAYYQLIFVIPQRRKKSDLPKHVAERSRGTFQFLVDRLRDVLPNLSAEQLQDWANTTWALSHGLVSLYIAGQLEMEETQFRKLWSESHAALFVGLDQFNPGGSVQ